MGDAMGGRVKGGAMGQCKVHTYCSSGAYANLDVMTVRQPWRMSISVMRKQIPAIDTSEGVEGERGQGAHAAPAIAGASNVMTASM